MSFSKVYSAQIHLLKTYRIDIEVDLSRGLNAFSIVGLPDKAVAESKDRVSAAIKNSGFVSPKNKNQKVIISLAPADIKKEGPNFDVAIALSYLLAAGEIKFDPSDKIFLGELSLDGMVRATKGILPLVLQSKALGFKEIYIPFWNLKEASIIKGINIFGFKSLTEVINHLNRKKPLEAAKQTEIIYPARNRSIDLRDIKGQEHAKRALLISSAGGHSIMMYGPPGTGKTMLAQAYSYLLPPLSFEEILETTSIHSGLGISNELILYPPLRAPHHTSSYTSLIGGGAVPRPGEISLAHRGVLFMDEFPEFDIKTIESLRQPLENKKITISRGKSSVTFPSNFILVATMNPCPCGNKGVEEKECRCKESDIQRYERKISDPIIDRIDMWIEVSKVNYENLGNENEGTGTEQLLQKVLQCRDYQRKRFAKQKQTIRLNSEIPSKNIMEQAKISQSAKMFLNENSKRLMLSARGYHRIIRLARTISDLKESEDVGEEEVLEALQYRFRGKQG